MVIRDGETNWEHGEAMWESIFQTKCTQKPLAQLFELEDPWCSYAGIYLWAWSLCHGLGYHLQHLEEHARPQDTYAWLIVFFWLQITIAYWWFRILLFLKYCIRQNWSDILEYNADVDRYSFLFSKTSRDNLNLKLNDKWNLSNIDTDYQWSGRFLGRITGWDPNVCNSNRLHVHTILWFSFIKLGYILYIPLKWLVIFLQSWT